MTNTIWDVSNYQANWLSTSSLSVAAIVLVLGVVGLIRSHYSYGSKVMIVLNINIAMWLFGFGMTYFSSNAVTALFWLNFAFYWVPILSPSAYFFLSTFLKPSKERRRNIFIF